MHHLVERVVAADLRVLGVVDRIEPARRRDEAGERRGLLHAEVGGVDAPVRLRRRLHAVRAVPQIDGVEVARQDLVLRQRLLELDRQQRLADLLLDRARGHDVLRRAVRLLDVAAGVDLLDELLGDRRAALHGLVLDQVGPRGAEDADRVDARMLVEAVVLDGDHGVAERLGHLIERDDRPVDRAVDRREQRAVAVVHERRLDRRQRLGQLDLRVRVDQPPADRQDDDDGHRDEDPPEPPEEALLRLPRLAAGVLRGVGTTPGRLGGGVGRHCSRFYPGQALTMPSLVWCSGGAVRIRRRRCAWR